MHCVTARSIDRLAYMQPDIDDVHYICARTRV
jgi:hypothetical protein